MRYDPNKHHRHAMRLQGYDYDQEGAYFVTICTFQREYLFGEIDAEGVMGLNVYGKIVMTQWARLPQHYPHVELDTFVVMPNHVHGIVVLSDKGTKKHGLSEIIRGFKTYSARRINDSRGTLGTPIWQRSFHDEIIRGETALNRIRQYIQTNPAQWAFDTENLVNVKPHQKK